MLTFPSLTGKLVFVQIAPNDASRVWLR